MHADRQRLAFGLLVGAIVSLAFQAVWHLGLAPQYGASAVLGVMVVGSVIDSCGRIHSNDPIPFLSGVIVGPAAVVFAQGVV